MALYMETWNGFTLGGSIAWEWVWTLEVDRSCKKLTLWGKEEAKTATAMEHTYGRCRLEAEGANFYKVRSTSGFQEGCEVQRTLLGNSGKDFLFCCSESNKHWPSRKLRILVWQPLLPQSLGALLAGKEGRSTLSPGPRQAPELGVEQSVYGSD